MTAAKKAAAKAPAKKKTEPDAPAAARASKVGTTVEIKADGPVEVRLPDGSTVVVHAKAGRALYVLDRPGVHTAGGLTFEAKA